MHPDVVQLRKFYYRTALGRAAQKAIRRRLRVLWPSVRGETVVGFGFAAPFLRPFMEEAERVLCLMPAQQGVCPWPGEGPNVSALVEERLWPLANGAADRLLVCHGLETCERPAALLKEIWRVLAPGGSAIFLVPNRTGAWARRDGTPFGFGRPYSLGQLERTLADAQFSADRHAAALYMAPSQSRFWLRLGPTIEAVGQWLGWQRLGGVVMVEATKLVFAKPRSGSAVAAREPVAVPAGLRPVAGRAASRASGGARIR